MLHDNQTSKLRADHETNHTVFVSHELKLRSMDVTLSIDVLFCAELCGNFDA